MSYLQPRLQHLLLRIAPLTPVRGIRCWQTRCGDTGGRGGEPGCWWGLGLMGGCQVVSVPQGALTTGGDCSEATQSHGPDKNILVTTHTLLPVLFLCIAQKLGRRQITRGLAAGRCQKNAQKSSCYVHSKGLAPSERVKRAGTDLQPACGPIAGPRPGPRARPTCQAHVPGPRARPTCQAQLSAPLSALTAALVPGVKPR
jgi:hypothetical protein